MYCYCYSMILGGSICLWCLYLYICTGISLYFLIEQWRDYSVLWQCWLGGPSAFQSQWHQWTVKRSLCALAVLTQGGPSAFGVCIFIYALVFPYIFLLNSEEITLFYDSVDWGGPSAFQSQWHQWTVKRSLCALAVLNWGVHLPLVSTCVLYALVFPYIFLLVDCFEWALIGDIEKCTVHSVLWQFWRGGPSAFGIYMFSLCTGISLYFLISWLFQMGSHWQHWKA